MRILSMGEPMDLGSMYIDLLGRARVRLIAVDADPAAGG